MNVASMLHLLTITNECTGLKEFVFTQLFVDVYVDAQAKIDVNL